MSPYEFHNDILGVQSRFLFEGRNAHSDSIGVIGVRGLQHRIISQTIVKLRSQAPGVHALVRWDSIPPPWQTLLIRKFGEPPTLIRKMLFEKFYERDARALTYFTNYKFKDGKYLPDDVAEEYTINASVLNTIITVHDKRYALRKVLRKGVADIWDIIANETQQFRTKQPHTLPDNVRRLREKVNEYKRNGFDVLIHKNYCNKSAAKVDDSVMSLLNSLFATQTSKPTATDVAVQYEAFMRGQLELINNETGELYEPYLYKHLSVTTIAAYLSKWKNQIGTHAKRSGNRQVLMGKFRPYHSLEQPKMAGSIISIDDRQPPFEYGKGKRAWFYNAIDLGSEAFTCWVHGKSKDGIILDFYRQLVRNYTTWGLNMPAELECESSLNSSFKKTFLREGAMFEYVRIEANNARGKRIERYYGALRYQVEKKREGWLARPFALSESNQLGGHDVPTLPYEEIINGCLRDIETWNNMPHSKIEGKTRWEVFMEMQNPNVKPTNWRAILPTLGYCTQTSCRVGIVKLNNGEFLLGENGKICFGETLINLMDQVEGRELDIYWLDDNRGEVMKALVYLRGSDRNVCELIAKPHYSRAIIERTPESLEQREAMSKYVATIDGFMNRQRKALDTITVIDNQTAAPGKFSMADMMPKASTTPPPSFDEPEEVEILKMPEEMDLMPIETTFKRSLKDRF